MIKKEDIIITKISNGAKARATKFNDFKESFVKDLSKNKKTRELYLEMALEEYEQEKNLENFLLALRTIAIANNGGIAELAKKTKLNRQSLYKALSPKGNPAFSTIDTILNSLGVKLVVHAL